MAEGAPSIKSLTIKNGRGYNNAYDIRFENALTKTVIAPGKAKRAGEGERPVRVAVQGRSLPSSQDQRGRFSR